MKLEVAEVWKWEGGEEGDRGCFAVGGDTKGVQDETPQSSRRPLEKVVNDALLDFRVEEDLEMCEAERRGGASLRKAQLLRVPN